MITQTKMILPLKETVQKISQKKTQCANYPHKKNKQLARRNSEPNIIFFLKTLDVLYHGGII